MKDNNKKKLKISYRANFLKLSMPQFDFFSPSFLSMLWCYIKCCKRKKKGKSTKPIHILLEKLNTLL